MGGDWSRMDLVGWRGMEGESVGTESWNWGTFGKQCGNPVQ